MKRLLLLAFLLVLLCVGVSAEDLNEPNDTSQTATVMELNSSVTANLSHFKDSDCYVFTVTKPGYFSLEFTHELLPDNNGYWGVHLYNEMNYSIDGSTSWLANYTVVRGNANWRSASYGVGAGTYYFSVHEAGNHAMVGMDYTVSVHFTPAADWEIESNTSIDNANPISPNSSIFGSLTSLGDADWYSFTVTSAVEMIFSVEHTEVQTKGNRFAIGLYDAYGERIVTTPEKDALASGTDLFYTVEAGKYYIHISADYGYNSVAPYRLTVAPNHDCYGEFIITQTPTCTAEGVQEKLCAVCGKCMESQAVPPLGHQSDGWTVDVPATCTQAGQHHGFCARCQTNATESIPMLPHAFGAWEQVSGSKLIPPIVSEQTCSVCGHIAQEKDWSYVWLPIVIVLAAIALIIGIISYFKAFKKS